MPALIDNLWQIILMGVLLVLSGFISGAETAYFNLSRRHLESLAASNKKLHILAAKLLASPKQLLTSLLFANMAINVGYFALASVLSLRITDAISATGGAAVAVSAFMLLLMFGEMLPKSLAYSHSKKFCIYTASGCYVTVRVLSRLLTFFEFVVVGPALKLILGPGKGSGASGTVTADQFKILIESSRNQGLITSDENRLMAEVVELGLLKVRHVMKPRVDMAACQIIASAKTVQQIMIENSLTRIAVYEKDIDNIVGMVGLREILLNDSCKVSGLLEPADFVPEQKSVESLLEYFRKNGSETAIVVDEYGGIAGIVSVEDIVEELLGPIDASGQGETIEQIGPLEYRLDANIAIHDWAQAFGINPAQSRLSTIGGVATALLGKIPQPGDKVALKNMTITVEKVRKHRIQTLIMSLEPMEQ